LKNAYAKNFTKLLTNLRKTLAQGTEEDINANKIKIEYDAEQQKFVAVIDNLNMETTQYSDLRNNALSEEDQRLIQENIAAVNEKFNEISIQIDDYVDM
jgi:diketogulonate reductase-like aldo/keto reductase